MEQAVYLTERHDAHADAVDSSSPNSPQAGIFTPPQRSEATAKHYAKIKLIASLMGSVLFFVLSLALVATGTTVAFESFVRSYVSNDYLALLGFAALLGLAEMALTAPLQFYSAFYLEHKYNLSNQTFRAWLWEGFKGFLVSVPITLPLLLALFFCLKSFGSMWWLPVGSVLFFFSVVLARLAPVLIFPLFYTFKPLPDGELRSIILGLCQSVGMSVKGVYVFDMSKSTKKANAAFTGIGKSKRIILGDTLVANFRNDEIESVFAHELGHYKLKHLWMMLGIGTVSSFLGLSLTAQAYELSLPWFGFASIDQLAALPLLALWLGVYSFLASPLTNAISRSHERAADRYAISLTNNGEAFANALQKLARINLADVSPHPVVEFLFHSHPSIEKRVRSIGTKSSSPRAGGAQ
ncbi:MAG: M48 family metallopeptidase [Ignavibacteriales bacterium]|nr:M48 family metallopeptidase [Ignavibacteriales bacterium]